MQFHYNLKQFEDEKAAEDKSIDDLIDLLNSNKL